MKKAVDINGNLLQLDSWNGVLLFWGVRTSSTSGICTSRLNGVFLDSMVGEMVAYTTSSFELKAIVTVLCGFLNSPIAKASIKSIYISSLLWRSKQWLGGGIVLSLEPLCFNLKGKIL